MSRLHVIDHTTTRPDPPSGFQTAAAVLAGDDGVGACVQGIYVHVPFCVHRCHYCDFFTIAGRDSDRMAYVDRLLDEAGAVIPALRPGVTSVFIGGGTPTHLPPAGLRRLLEGLSALLDRGGHQVREWTVEANPETVTDAIAGVLAGCGVGRVSVGAQSFDRRALAALERRHTVGSVPMAVDVLRRAGITEISLDLIFGVPGLDEPLTTWAWDLDQAIALAPSHLSCYGLTYEPGTPLRHRLEQGRVRRVSDDVERAMYERTCSALKGAGFEHYEISNWAVPGHRCLHNETYWKNRNWWPLGPSASGHVDGTRWRNVPRLGPWLAGKGLSSIDTVERLDSDGRAGEQLMLGLRLLDGVPRDVIERGCSTPLRGAARSAAIESHVQAGLLVWAEDHLRLTSAGLLLADSVMCDVL